MIQIPFHPRFTEEIEAGRKQFTIRLNPGYDPEPGDPLELVDDNREQITTATTRLNATVPAGFIPSWQFEGHREYATFHRLQEELAEYYPDTDITPNTPVVVIGW
jgi:uncharacterized protein YqfB (UPF0267 family)